MNPETVDILIALLKSHWEISQPSKVEPVWVGLENQNFLVHTAEHPYFLQTSNSPFQPQLTAFKTSLLNWLVEQGLTECIAPLPASNGAGFIEDPAVGTITVYPAILQQKRFIPAENEAADQQAGIQLADWIARLHALTADAPKFISRPKESLDQNFAALKAHFPTFQKIGSILDGLPLDANSKQIWRTFLQNSPRYYERLFDNDFVFKLLEKCHQFDRLVHNDLNLSNLSFSDDGQLKNVYDFDNAGLDCRAADLQFIYYYYYHPTLAAGNDYFDIPKLAMALSAYERQADQSITHEEKQLCALLGMDRSLRGLLWLFDMFSKGAPAELFKGVDYRVRPARDSNSAELSAAFVTFAKLFNGIETFSQIDQFAEM